MSEFKRIPPEQAQALRQDIEADTPPLIKGYLRAGAWICGEPAWDPDFNTADLPVLLPEKIFDWVESWVWTSSPITTSHFMPRIPCAITCL